MTDEKCLPDRREYQFGNYKLSWVIPAGCSHKDAEGLFACSKFAEGLDLPPRFEKEKRLILTKYRRKKSEYSFEFGCLLTTFGFCRWAMKFLIAEMDIIQTKLSGSFWTTDALQDKIRDCLYYYRGEVEKFLIQLAEAWFVCLSN